MGTTAIYGVGAMGEAVLAGLRRADADVVIADTSGERASDMSRTYGVSALGVAEAARSAQTHLVIVKPHDVAGLLEEIGPHLGDTDVVISLAAGQTTAALESHLPAGTAVVRGMPNTPALVGQGMTALSPGTHCSEQQLEAARGLLSATGRVVTVPEAQQDTVVAISGSGPAYVFAVAEAMIDGGVLLGMSRATATELAVQTLLGASTMLAETGEHPTLLRERVTSPGGTTAAALRTLDARAVHSAIIDAMEVCARRSGELA